RIDGVLHAQLEFFDVERLGDVIVCAQFQPGDLVAALVLLCQKDDGDMAGAGGLAQFAADIVAVHIGQHNVEDDQMRKLLAGGRQRIAPARGDLDFVALPGKVNPQHVGNIKIVFDDGDSTFIHNAPHHSLPDAAIYH